MKAIIYARVSSTTDRQNTDRQIFCLRNYAEMNGYEVIQVFSEKISGAVKNGVRKEFSKCLTFAKENCIDVILVSEFSRFGRNTWEVLESLKYCIDNEINVYFQKENIQIFGENKKVSPLMAIYLVSLSSAAEMERENIAFRLNSGRQIAIQRGVKMGRKVGYRKTKEKKAEEYREALSLLKKGLSVANATAICKQKGQKISESTVKRLKKEFCIVSPNRGKMPSSDSIEETPTDAEETSPNRGKMPSSDSIDAAPTDTMKPQPMHEKSSKWNIAEFFKRIFGRF